MPNYQARIGQRSYAVSADDINRLDLQRSGPDRYHLLHDKEAYQVKVLDVNRITKRVRLSVNGQDFTVDLRDKVDQRIDALGFATTETTVNKDVLAPMPGLVLDILVEAGQEVAAGTPLIILEAMKMENVLKAEGDGTIGDISVKKGQAVEKRQLLISID